MLKYGMAWGAIGLFVVVACAELSAPPVEHVLERVADSFTQGLEFHDDFLYESSGLYGKSFLRKSKIESGHLKVVSQVELPGDWFAEGLTFVGSDLYLLTWQEGIVSIRDSETLVEKGRKYFEGEGWGIAFDGISLWMSDGSSWLTERDPETFEVIQRVQVTYRGQPVERLNELEWDGRHLYANQWKSDYIYRIEPRGETPERFAAGKAKNRTAGKANERMQLSHLVSWNGQISSEGVLNGLAHKDRKLYVTGKQWGKVYVLPL